MADRRFVRRQRPLELAPALLEWLKDDPAATRRQQLYERQAEATAAVRKAVQEVERAKAEDARRAGEALAEDPGRKLPASQVPKAEQARGEVERKLAAVDAALAQATADLLRAGMAVAADLHDDLVNRSRVLEGEVESLLDQAAEAGVLHGRLMAEAGWIRQLVHVSDPRRVSTYVGSGRQSPLGRCVGVAQAEIAELKRKQAEREERERRAAEREAENVVGTDAYGRPVFETPA